MVNVSENPPTKTDEKQIFFHKNDDGENNEDDEDDNEEDEDNDDDMIWRWWWWDEDEDEEGKDEDDDDDGKHGELLGVVWLRWQQETNNHLGKITYPSLGDILSLWEILYTITWTPFFLKNFITIPLFVAIIFTTFTFFSFGSRWVLVLPRSSTRTTLTWELAIGAVSVSIYGGLRQWSMLKNLCNW